MSVALLEFVNLQIFGEACIGDPKLLDFQFGVEPTTSSRYLWLFFCERLYTYASSLTLLVVVLLHNSVLRNPNGSRYVALR